MEQFGVKELYDVSLCANSDMYIDGKQYIENEPIITFNNIQIAYMQEHRSRQYAKGGQGNQELIKWDKTQNLSLQFTNGVLSKSSLSILSNSSMCEKQNETLSIYQTEIAKMQILENGYNFIVKHNIDTSKQYYVYLNGKKITNITVSGKTITYNSTEVIGAEDEVRVYYYFTYEDDTTEFLIGKRKINGYLSLYGKMRIKDDQSGENKTCLIYIPKVKLMSDLAFRLGDNISPSNINFIAEGIPTEINGDKIVEKLTILNNDIDSDI